jgi:hypothetical protein
VLLINSAHPSLPNQSSESDMGPNEVTRSLYSHVQRPFFIEIFPTRIFLWRLVLLLLFEKSRAPLRVRILRSTIWCDLVLECTYLLYWEVYKFKYRWKQAGADR